MSSKKQKLLITGGAGFIGTNLAKSLIRQTDWDINILDNLSTGNLDNLKKLKILSLERVKFFLGDIRNKKDVIKAFEDSSLVVNLAGQTKVIFSQKNSYEDAEINIIGLLNLLEMAKDKKIEKFVQASSAAPLGEQKIMPLDETKVPLPLSPYGASKLAGEGYCSAYSGSFGLKTIVLRFSNVYGPFSEQKGSVIPKFIEEILKNQAVNIFGDGEQTRDFIYVEDICQGIYLALIKSLSHNFELFQLGTGEETSINQIFSLLEKFFVKKNYKIKKARYKPKRKGEIKRNYTSISKAKKFLSFQPQVGLARGLRKTIDYFLSI